MNGTEILNTAQQIKNYLLQRPGATDTAEGIHQFWITSLAPLAVTVSALKQLEESGEVEKFNIGNRIVWRLKRK